MITFTFVEGAPSKPFEQAVLAEMDKSVKFLEKEFTKIRAGRAHSSLVEDIKVNCYGNLMPLKQLAAISIPDASLIVIQPWDKGLMSEIEKTLSTSELGVSPVNDGNVIRITLPRLSSERRDEFVKMVGKKLEETKVAIRTVRKDYHNLVREAEKGKKISEDYSKRVQDVLQKVTDKVIESVEKMAHKKEEEIKGV